MPPPFDYRELRLHKDGSIVDDVRMLWSAIEQFSNVACGRGCNTLRDSRAMPLSVEADLAYRGRCEALLGYGRRGFNNTGFNGPTRCFLLYFKYFDLFFCRFLAKSFPTCVRKACIFPRKMLAEKRTSMKARDSTSTR